MSRGGKKKKAIIESRKAISEANQNEDKSNSMEENTPFAQELGEAILIGLTDGNTVLYQNQLTEIEENIQGKNNDQDANNDWENVNATDNNVVETVGSATSWSSYLTLGYFK